MITDEQKAKKRELIRNQLKQNPKITQLVETEIKGESLWLKNNESCRKSSSQRGS